ncbi:hypothetical protein GW17_00019977 [Ensete ventricosum]|nr:hypothetical protein GW17_00019977 [Ensete ventricosum]
MDRYGWLSSLVPQSNSIPRTLLVVLLLYSFTSQFLPIEPYLVPYLTSVKNFTNYQVLHPLLSCYRLISLGIRVVCSYGRYGSVQLAIEMQIARVPVGMPQRTVIYGFGTSARLVFSSYIFLLVAEEEYQTMVELSTYCALAIPCQLFHTTTSLTQTVSLLSFVLASELVFAQSRLKADVLKVSIFFLFIMIGQFLALKEVPYEIFFIISLTALGVCCTSTFLLPKDHSSSALSSLTILWHPSEVYRLLVNHESALTRFFSRAGRKIEATWAVAFAGISLELSGLSIFSQFIAFSGLFFVATAILICFSYIDNGKDTSNMYMISEPEPE